MILHQSDGALDEKEIGKKVRRIEDKSQYKRAISGDLVFNMMRAWQGAIGVVCTDGMVSPAYIVAAPNSKIYPLFMNYYMKTTHMINTLHRQSYGVMDFRLRLYWDSFASISCCIPCVTEQQKIAEILTTCDKVIELKEKRIIEKKRRKRYLMQQLLTGQKRLRGYDEEWKRIRLGKILKERKTYSQKGTGYTHVTLSTQGIHPKSNRYDREHLVKAEDKVYKITHLNDVCYNPANLKFGVICLNTFGDAIFSPIYVTFEIRKDVFVGFLSQLIVQADFIQAALKYEEGTVYERMAVKPSDFLKIEVRLPPLDEQKTIAKILSLVDHEIELLQRDLEEEKLKKKALMQLLLTGIVRVNT